MSVAVAQRTMSGTGRAARMTVAGGLPRDAVNARASSHARGAGEVTVTSDGLFRGGTMVLAAAVALTALLPTDVRAEERLDHHGAVGLLIGSGVDLRQELTPPITGAPVQQGGGRYVLFDVGGTYNVGDDSNELKLVLRAALFGPRPLGIVYGGYRAYFGAEEWKTFFDLDLRVDVLPTTTLGPRMGIGVQYELGSLVGVYSGIAAHVGAGAGIRFGGEFVVGVQLRSFLLE